MVGAGRPVERAARAPLPQPPQPDREPRDRGLTADRLRTEPVHLGDPVARPRRVDGGQLVAERRDEVALGAGHLRRSARWSDRPVVRRRIPASPSSARMTAAPAGPGRGGAARRVDDVVEDEPRDGLRRPAASAADRSGGRRPRRRRDARRPPRRRGPRRRGCWRGRCRRGSRPACGDERLDVRRQVEAGRLAFLRRHVADEDAGRDRPLDRVADGRDEQARQEARVEAARAEDDELGVGDRRQRVLGGLDAVGGDPDAIDARGPHDLRLPVDDRAVRQPGVERERRRRDGHDLAADGEDPVHQPDAVLEVAALDRGHRRDQQVPERVPGEPAGLLRPASRGKRYWRTSLISGSASARATMQLRMSPTGGMPSSLAQDAGRAAVVGDGDDRGQVAGVLLEAAQQRRQPRPATDRHDPRPAREEALLVDELDQRLLGVGRPERLGQDAGDRGTSRRRPARPRPSRRRTRAARTAGTGGSGGR